MGRHSPAPVGDRRQWVRDMHRLRQPPAVGDLRSGRHADRFGRRHRGQLPPRAGLDRRRGSPATWPDGSSDRPCTRRCRAWASASAPTRPITAYREDYTSRGWARNRLFDGIDRLLADLRDAAGVRLAVATSKAEPTARRILDHFGLTDHFEVIAGASVDGSRSSKADVVAHALAQLDPVPARVLMVGDRAHDVAGAAEHGIDTVVVGWGYGRRGLPGARRRGRGGRARPLGAGTA